jgi:hypothetical protein
VLSGMTLPLRRPRSLVYVAAGSLVVCMLLVCGPAQARRTMRRATAAVPGPALFNREIYGYQSALSPGAEARRYSVIVMQTTDAAWVRVLHRYNPKLKVLMYMGVLWTAANDPQYCTSYSDDLINHPDWFLRNSAGQPAFTPAHPPNLVASYHMDVGVPGYQQACIAHAIAVAKAGGFDGVYLDGIDASMGWQFNPFTIPSVPKYPNDAAWQAAITSFLTYAHPVVRAHGLLLFGNMGEAPLPLWEKWNALMDGGELESFTDDGGGLAGWLWWWPRNLAAVAWSEAHGKYVILHSHNLTPAGNTFGLATMLLVARVHSSYSTSNANYDGDERWYAAYNAAVRLGRAEGAYTRHGNVYERRFAHGIVLVNPTTSSVRRLRLGARYSGLGIAHASAVSMAPTSALIMTAG